MISPLFIFFFRYYVNLLFYRRFRRVWLDQHYYPGTGHATLYFLNHNSWWDGLVPLLLNEFRFHQQAKAVMDSRQLEKHPFFKKIGAYPIDRTRSRKAVAALLYTAELLKQKGTSVFIYPQGVISDPSMPLRFEKGIGLLHERCEGVDFVPIALHQHTLFSDKPDLFIKTGNPVRIEQHLTRNNKTLALEDTLNELLVRLRMESCREDLNYERLV
ncbi:MAG: lysophospholipid acyltransferase family protein [Balneolales bacterium]